MQPESEESHNEEEVEGYDSDQCNDDEEAEKFVTLHDFYKTWEHVDTPIGVSVAGEAQGLPCLPGLCVNGVGDIPLPVNRRTAEDLKKVCHQAPRRSNTFQVKADQVYVKNPVWNEAINKLVQEVAIKLGVMADLVSSRLEKLLLQEEGESVEEYVSTDQERKEFAKLFVQLPSTFTGGSFVVTDDDGFKKNFAVDSEESAPFQCKYLAHYSECKHESLPIDFGCRVVLVYSLLYNGNERSKPSVRDIKNGRLLTLFRRLEEGVSVVGVPMKNYFEFRGIEGLKGSDRIFAESALQAGGWKVFIASLKRVDTESADDEYWARFEESCISEGEQEVDKLYLLDGSNGIEHQSWIEESLDISSIECRGLSWNETDTSEVECGGYGEPISREITYEAYALIAFRDNLRCEQQPSKRRRTVQE